MLTVTDYTLTIFKKMIDEEVTRLMHTLAHNNYMEVWEFKKIVGKIEGLEEAAKILIDAKEKADR
jgi:hypothetical protein